VLGLDFGRDSVRTLAVSRTDGTEIASVMGIGVDSAGSAPAPID